jgi:hypothetical protein
MSHKDNFTDLIEGLPQESEPQEPSQQVMDSDVLREVKSFETIARLR